MNVEDIKPDEIVTLTEEMRRVFVAAGCEPECHACYKRLTLGVAFKLATVKRRRQAGRNRVSYDVMLCAKCTPADLPKEAMSKKAYEKYQAELPAYVRSGGCFRVNGKIVTTLDELS